MNFRTDSLRASKARFVFPVAALALAACGGGGGGGGGDAPPPPPPAAVVTDYDVTLSSADVVAGSAATGSATAVVRHNSTDQLLEITVTLSNITATAISMRRGYAGDEGPVLHALQQGTAADTWVLASQSVTATDAGDLLDGALYLEVASAAFPNGALRGQVLPAPVEVHRIDLSATDVTAGSSSAGTGVLWLTLNHRDATVTAHARLQDLADADAGFVRDALAGLDGPVLETLAADPASNDHWLLDTRTASAELLDAFSAGRLYAEFTTPSLQEGAIRGQHVPAGIELVRTDVREDALVMSANGGHHAGTAGRMMTTLGSNALSAAVNLFDVSDATAVELRQAPPGQNGPSVAAFEQDINNGNRWLLQDLAIDPVLRANLDNRTLYVLVTTSGAPDGAARGQLETAASSAPANASAFVVTMIDPPNANKLDDLPGMVYVTLNREPLPASASPQAVSIEASGQDGSFGDGNETTITPASVAANGNTIEISLAGVQAGDDVYRVMLAGGGAHGITDMSGIGLDGDNDGQPGGVYESAFEVEQPVFAATLSRIQEEIFTPTCATAGCHSGNNPPDGLLLTAGDAWSNIVDVDAVQMNLKRIAPGDPDNSYLVRKIQGTGIVANRMPLGAPPLSQQEIDLVRQWVLEGAADN